MAVGRMPHILNRPKETAKDFVRRLEAAVQNISETMIVECSFT